MKALAAVILIVAAVYLWADRIQVVTTPGAIIAYNKWTGHLCNISDRPALCDTDVPRNN
jgi:hypothetical protein